MKIDQFTSDKMRVLSFASIILVLYIHSGFHDTPNEIGGMPFNHYLQEAISGVVGRMAVPLFFMISGYLFFRNVNRVGDVLPKMRKRVRTLVVPFVIAALFAPLVMLAIKAVPQAARYINGGDAEGVSREWWANLAALFCIGPAGDLLRAFQLWFLRDLIVVVALSPVLQTVRSKMGGVKQPCCCSL